MRAPVTELELGALQGAWETLRDDPPLRDENTFWKAIEALRAGEPVDVRWLEREIRHAGLLWRFPELRTWADAASDFARQIEIACVYANRVEHAKTHAHGTDWADAAVNESLEILEAHVKRAQRTIANLRTQMNLIVQYEQQGAWYTADARLSLAMDLAYDEFDDPDALGPLADVLQGPGVKAWGETWPMSEGDT